MSDDAKPMRQEEARWAQVPREEKRRRFQERLRELI